MRFLNTKDSTDSDWKALEKVVLTFGVRHRLDLRRMWRCETSPSLLRSVSNFAKATRPARNALGVHISRPSTLGKTQWKPTLPVPLRDVGCHLPALNNPRGWLSGDPNSTCTHHFLCQKLPPLQCLHCLEASQVCCVRRARWPGGASHLMAPKYPWKCGKLKVIHLPELFSGRKRFHKLLQWMGDWWESPPNVL